MLRGNEGANVVCLCAPIPLVVVGDITGLVIIVGEGPPPTLAYR
jgi:hypothetical protein